MRPSGRRIGLFSQENSPFSTGMALPPPIA
jgi:hypothetical protein